MNVSYTVQDTNNTYTKNASVWVKKSTTGSDFELYSMTLGGALTVQDANGTITVTVAKPSGTEIITFTGAGVVVYTAAVEPTPTDKQTLFRKADADGNGKIDARDASTILAYVAALSTGQAEGGDEGFRAWCMENNITTGDGLYIFPDANLDGRVNSIDASYVLTFYSEASGGHYTNNPDGWYQYLIDKNINVNI